jgi:phosphate-selective porin OprO and OprP
MQERTRYRLAWTLAIVAAWGANSAAWGQVGPAPGANDGSGYYNAPELTRTPPTAPAGQNQPVSQNPATDPESLAARVAELEKALKKADDKAKADKAKADAAPSVKVIGRFQYDCAAFSQNANSIASAGDMKNGTEFRRARIGVMGDAFQVIDYKIEMDFAGQSATGGTTASAGAVYLQQTLFKDVYITIKELPIAGNIRVGKFYECFGLETQTSDNYVTFMERSLISGGVGKIGDRKPGVMLFDWNEAETMTWAAGAFAWQANENPPTFPLNTQYDDAGGTSFDTRVTWLPWYDEATDGRGYMHLGANYSYRSIAELVPGSTATRYSISQLPECHLANVVVNTGNLADATALNVFGPEFVWTYGAFSVQSEYLWIAMQRSAHDNPNFDGGYVQASYFLTGEHRPYIRKEGLIGRVIPFENFFRVRTEDGCVATGKGAWEVGYRLSYLNLTNAGVTGGRVTDNTFGLTWYLNPYTKLLFNYVHSETTAEAAFGRSIVDLVETRAMINF